MAPGKTKRGDEDDMDLDDELLQLTEKKSNKRGKDSDSDDDRKKKKPAPLKRPMSTFKSSSSRGGVNRGRSSNDSDDDEFNDGYDEYMYKDDEDRDNLSRLPEVEREDILADRYEKRKEAQEILKARRQQQQQLDKSRQDDNYRGQSSSSSSSSRSTRRSSTVEDESGKGKALKVIKEKSSREKERERERERDRDRDRKGSSSSGSGSKQLTEEQQRERHREKEMEIEREREREKERERDRERDIQNRISQKIQTFDIQILNQIRLSRNMLVKWVDQPYFEKYTPGFFVRVAIGKFQNLPVYRIGKIVGISGGHKIYKVENKETDKLLKLSYAGTIKEFTIDLVSNNPITNSEHERWVQDMVRANVDLPTEKEIQNKLADIKKANDYIYTDQDIEKRAKERKKFNKAPVNYAFKKAQAIAKRETFPPDSEEYKKLCTKIEKYTKYIESIQLDDSVAKINQRNKSFNIKSQQQVVTDSVQKEVDPFARRKTRSKFEIENPNNPLALTLPPPKITPIGSSIDSKSNGVEGMEIDTPKRPDIGTLSEIHNSIDLNIIIPDHPTKILSAIPTIKKYKVSLNGGLSVNDDFYYKTQDPTKYKNFLSLEEYVRKTG